MGAIQEREYALVRGGSAPASTIDRVLTSLQSIARSRSDAQDLLRNLSVAATPQSAEIPLKLNAPQLAFLRNLGLTDSNGALKDQKTAMVVCSCIHFSEGAYSVFAPIG